MATAINGFVSVFSIETNNNCGITKRATHDKENQTAIWLLPYYNAKMLGLHTKQDPTSNIIFKAHLAFNTRLAQTLTYV